MKGTKSLLFTADHAWIKIDNDTGYIGITDFAQRELGNIVFVQIETLEERLLTHENFGSIKSEKDVFDLFLPVEGEVIQINEKLKSNPELVNTDPYGEGWLIKLKIENINEAKGLLSYDSYVKLIGHDQRQ